MKITDFIIVFFIVFIPILFFIEAKSENTETFIQLNHQHEGAMTVAAQDAIHVLRTNVIPKMEVGYESYKINPADPQPSLNTFLETLALNFQVEDSITADVMSRYVPVYAVLDYDGLVMSVYKEYQNSNNEKVLDRVWLPKIPFSYSDTEGNIINFTIDQNVEVYDVTLDEWFEGKRTELLADVTIPLLTDAEQFDQVRRTTIVNTLQENIAYYINQHNVYRKELDVTYDFALPLINQEDWYNTVDDVSVLAFFQGYPYRMAEEEYHEYAFVGTRLNRNDVIMAGMVNGERKYWYKSCNYPYTAIEIYNTRKDAAAHGYSELSCLNPLE